MIFDNKLATNVVLWYLSHLGTIFTNFSIQISMNGPQGIWGSGANGYLFSGIWGALVFILGELGSKLILFGI